jgi:hypothetical protein
LLLYIDTVGGASPITGSLVPVPNLDVTTTGTTSINSTTPTSIGAFTTEVGYPGIASFIGGFWNTFLYAGRSGTGESRFWVNIDEMASNGTTVLQGHMRLEL